MTIIDSAWPRDALHDAFRALLEGGATSAQRTLVENFMALISPFENLTPEELVRKAAEHGTTPVLIVQRAVEALLEGRLKIPPGLFKGRSAKKRMGGEWTPILLRAEMVHLGISAVRLSKVIGVSHSAVNKWLHIAIPDLRQEAITKAMASLKTLAMGTELK